jgi:hypothetical protein
MLESATKLATKQRIEHGTKVGEVEIQTRFENTDTNPSALSAANSPS